MPSAEIRRSCSVELRSEASRFVGYFKRWNGGVLSRAQVFAVYGSFFQHAMDEGLTEANPFRSIKQKSIYKQRNTLDVASRSLTELQWGFVIDTAEHMVDDDPRHERTLFVRLHG